jgi:hypothetical protein
MFEGGQAVQFGADIGHATRNHQARASVWFAGVLQADGRGLCRARHRGHGSAGSGWQSLLRGLVGQPSGPDKPLHQHWQRFAGLVRAWRQRQPAVDQLQRRAPSLGSDADSHVKLQKGVGHRQDWFGGTALAGFAKGQCTVLTKRPPPARATPTQRVRSENCCESAPRRGLRSRTVHPVAPRWFCSRGFPRATRFDGHGA